MALSNFYSDYLIETAPEGHKHSREDWINVPCPYCTGSQGYHLGYNTTDNYFFCWRCGHHPILSTLMKLANISHSQAREFVKQYRIRKGGRKRVASSNEKIKINRYPFKFPTGIGPLNKAQIKYLERRNFDPEELIKKWGVLGTSPMSQLDGIQYKYRILVPIYWEGKLVSFQTRDYTNKQEKKYMACPQKREVIHHKHLLYGQMELQTDIGICVEGVFDVWRLGGRAFSTLGIGYTREQVYLISKLFEEVFIIFDPEKQAQEQAEKLRGELRARKVKVHIHIGLDSDPAALSQDDANHLLKELKLWQ